MTTSAQIEQKNEHSDLHCPNERFDVLVIGAGIGGLTAGVLLARKGHRVCVLESHDKVGGLASSWERRIGEKKFVFSAGVQDISGFGPGGTFENLLSQSPFRSEIRWLQTSQRHIGTSGVFDISGNVENLLSLLAEKFPGDAGGMRAFFAEMTRLLHLRRREGLKSMSHEPPVNLDENSEKTSAIPQLFQEPYLMFLRRFVKNPLLEDLLTNICNYLTDSPALLSLGNAVPLHAYHLEGGFYPAGGIRKLADLLAREIEFRGGIVLCRTTADKILPPANDAAEILVGANGRFFRTRAVIANRNVSGTFRNFLPTMALPLVFRKRLFSRVPGPSAVLMNMACEGVFDIPEHTFVRDGTRVFALANPSRHDNSLAPPGHSAMSAIKLLSHEESVRWLALDGDAYREKKTCFTKAFIRDVETSFPQLRGHILHVETATPRTFLRFCQVPYGMIYGHAFGTWSPLTHSPVKWLFFAGADTNLGPGVEAVAISGYQAARSVNEFLSA